MFFFFPFAAEPASAPASGKVPEFRSLPMLPAPASREVRNIARPGKDGPGNAIFEAAQIAMDLLRRAIAALTSSLTALGSRTSALFAQVSANLAFDRAARDTASSFGMSWPGSVLQGAGTGFDPAGWFAPFQQPAPVSAFGFPGIPANPFAGNPFSLFTEALDMWTGFLMPAAPPKRPAPNTHAVPAPATATITFPGGSWSFTWG